MSIQPNVIVPFGSLSLETLPREIQLEIMKKLPVQDLLRLSMTCRSLNGIIDNEKFWEQRYYEKFPYVPEPAARTWKERFISVSDPHSSKAAYIYGREHCPQILSEVADAVHSFVIEAWLVSGVAVGSVVAVLTVGAAAGIVDRDVSDVVYVGVAALVVVVIVVDTVVDTVVNPVFRIIGNFININSEVGANIVERIGSLQCVRNLMGRANLELDKLRRWWRRD